MLTKKVFVSIAAVLLCLYLLPGVARSQNPLRLAVAGLVHGHAPMILGRPDRGDVKVVGIYEPRRDVFDRYATRFKLSPSLHFTDLERMLDELKPEAVAAFGTTFDHLAVVRACAPRKIHVMVEKPLAVSLKDAQEIEALAKKHNIKVLTNYETTWYASNHYVYDLAKDGKSIGPIRKMVIHDGHPGPREINVQPEFFEWLTDPILNGAGALTDFGCYGANLATWLMNGEEPIAVTAVTQQFKPSIYPKVEDEATIILQYKDAQAIIQASWNWPTHRKDTEVYGRDGYAHAIDARNVRLRKIGDTKEETALLERRPEPYGDSFAYLTAVIRGKIEMSDKDLSSLTNNVSVMRILDAAKRSAAAGTTINLRPTNFRSGTRFKGRRVRHRNAQL